MEEQHKEETNACNVKDDNANSGSKTVGNGNTALSMLSAIDFDKIDKKQRGRKHTWLIFESDKSRKIHPPSIQELMEAERAMYMKNTLDSVVLNYQNLSYGNLVRAWDCYNDYTFEEKHEELYILFHSYDNYVMYERAVRQLLENKVGAAKAILLNLVNDAVEPACYAYVVMFFKELLKQCDVLNSSEENVKIVEKNRSDIKMAVRLLQFANYMEPACSFVLGMIYKFNIGNCSGIISSRYKNDLYDAVNVNKNSGFLNIPHYFLKYIDRQYSWNDNESPGLGMMNKPKFVQEMGVYALYEITFEMLSQEYCNMNVLNTLFEILIQHNFSEALYTYAANRLLPENFGNNLETHKTETMKYLNACEEEHEGAAFLLGTLPFRKTIACRLTMNELQLCVRKLERYIDEPHQDECDKNERNKKIAAHCLAAEYYSEQSYLIMHNKEKAVEILNSRGMYEALANLQTSGNANYDKTVFNINTII